MQLYLKTALFALVPFTLLTSLACAQTDENSDLVATYSEYDRWKGSSLGIRIETKEGGYFVSKVLAHLDDHPLKVGDQLLEIGDIVLADTPLSEVGNLLQDSRPGTELPFKIIRGESESKMIKVNTYRHEFVDIASIVDRIKANTIILEHLEKMERSHEMESIAEKMVTAVENSKSPRQAHEGINQVIDDLGISHTAIVPKATYQKLISNDGGELGLVLRRFQVNGRSGYFVIDFKPGTPAHLCGIKLGDEIAFINGVTIDESRRLILAGEEQKYHVFGLLADAGEEIRLDHRSRANGPLRSTTITSGRPVSLGDSVAASAQVIEQNQRSIGYIRFWNLMSIAASRELQTQLETTFKNCDALVVDLRGRGGTVPTVLAVDRAIGKIDFPVVAITDELTRSAKELLSYRIKRHEHVTVIGEKTTGAVTAATFANLPSGNVLMFPVASSDSLKRYTDGTILEGNGVEPDEPVEFSEPFCEGQDKLLKTALSRAVQLTAFD